MIIPTGPSCVLPAPATATVLPDSDLLEQDFLHFVAQLVPDCSDDARSGSERSLLENTHGPTVTYFVTADRTPLTPVLGRVNSNFSEPDHTGAHPTWNPTPSVPDFYREELTWNLAEGLEDLPSHIQKPTVLKRDRYSNDAAAADNIPHPGQANLQHPSSASAADILERKRAVNRQAQQVFRNKQKVHRFSAFI